MFISWSGDTSRKVADALAEWLPRIVNAVDPWISTQMQKGARSVPEMTEALETTRFGVICLTRDNLQEPWIHFEAGALSKTRDALVWTFLHELTPADIEAPLSQFQHTQSTKDDVEQFVRAVNDAVRDSGEKALDDKLLARQFASLWGDLETALKAVPKPRGASSSAPMRSERAILEEVLETVRQLKRDEAPLPWLTFQDTFVSQPGGEGVMQASPPPKPIWSVYVYFAESAQEVEEAFSLMMSAGLIRSYQHQPLEGQPSRWLVRSHTTPDILERLLEAVGIKPVSIRRVLRRRVRRARTPPSSA